MMPQSKVSLRRNGRPQACEPCRKAKHRCDHSTPICNRCIVLGRPDVCVYHPAPATKVRKGSVTASPAKLPLLLPETWTPPPPPQTIRSPSPLAHEAPRATLFKRPGSRFAMTSFSAVFSENQDQIGADLLDVEEREDPEIEMKVYDDPVKMKLAMETLRAFPSPKTCQLLLDHMATIHDVTISQRMITHCLDLVWLTFGHALKGSVSNSKLSKMAYELFNNGKIPFQPDKNQAWVNWFSGSPLRWEMIGMLFCAFGLSMMRLQDWDPIFNQLGRHGQSRKSASLQMKECADACLNLRNRDHAKKDLVHCLFRNTALLHSQIAGDECDDLAMYEGRGIATYIEAGLHCLPENGPLESLSEYRKAISASGYRGEISGALFNARPPALSRFYCSYQIPLDLTEDQWFGSPEELAAAASQLDGNGWNTSGHISTVTWSRARCMLVPIREEILEISLGRNMKAAPGRIDQLIEELSSVTSSFPQWLQYYNISQWSRQLFSAERNKHFYIITRIQCEVLQTRFLLERLKQSSRAPERNQDLFNVAQQLMDITLSLWIDRDRLLLYQSVFHWLVVDYGIPAAGILCVELLYAVRHPHKKDQIVVSRSETIQSLTMFIAFLAWVRPDDGNHDLCRKFMKVIRNILNHVLEAPTRILAPLEVNETRLDKFESVETDQLNLDWSDLDDTDWLSLLNTMDWTQGFGPQ